MKTKLKLALGLCGIIGAGAAIRAFAAGSPADVMAYFETVIRAGAGQIPIANGTSYHGRSVSGVISLNALGVTSMANTSTDGNNYAPRLAQATYDFAVNGGSVGAKGLGVTLPANAVIMNSFMEVVTPIVSVGNNGTIAFSCEDANNIFTATDIDSSGAGAIRPGTALPSAPVGNIAAQCEINATIGTNAFTQGKVIIWVEYVVGQ